MKKTTIISIILIIGIFAVLSFWMMKKSSNVERNENENTNVIQENSQTDTFSFAIVADPHMDEQSNPEIFKQTLGNIVNENPSFVFDLGDTFMIDKLKNPSEEDIRERYILIKEYYDLLGDIPLYFAVGNHDGEAGWDKYKAKDYRLEYFPEQNYGENYYSFEENNALFIILDPFAYTLKKPNNDGWLWTLGKEQYNWLKEVLENSDSKNKFVFIHHLVGSGSGDGRGGIEYAEFYEWGGNNADGSYGFEKNRPDWSKPIHQLLIDNNVDIVFKGHDHFYAKQELDGIIYQTCPQPSHPGDKIDTAEEYGYKSGKIIGGSGFLKVQIMESGAKIEFIKAAGSIADSYLKE